MDLGFRAEAIPELELFESFFDVSRCVVVDSPRLHFPVQRGGWPPFYPFARESARSPLTLLMGFLPTKYLLPTRTHVLRGQIRQVRTVEVPETKIKTEKESRENPRKNTGGRLKRPAFLAERENDLWLVHYSGQGHGFTAE